MNVFQDGVRLFKEGKYNEAVEKLHIVAVAEHKNHKAWNALGVALSKTGDLEQSIICFENALSFDPGNTTYQKNLERARIKQSSLNIHVPPIAGPPAHETGTVSDHHSADVPKSSTLTFITHTKEPEMVQPLSVAGVSEKSSAATDLLERALSLFGQGSYHDMPDLMKEALDYTNRALDLDPDYYEAWQLKVSILTATGRNHPDDLNGALLACEKALILHPNQASMWYNKAGILENLGEHEEAIAAYEKAYGFSTDEPMRLGLILMKKGALLEIIGKEKEALETYNQVSVQDRFFGDAMEKRGEFFEKNGDEEAFLSSIRTAGISYVKAGRYDQAIESFNRLLSKKPGDEEAIYNKGVAFYGLFEKTQAVPYLEDALAAFDSAIRINPDNMTYLIQKGRCLIDMGRYEDGLQALDRALWINPGDGITLMNKGIALYQLSRHEEALKYFELVISLYPEHAASWMMKSRIHLDRKQYDAALSDIDQVIQRTPDDARAWDQRAVILHALGREEEAETAERKAEEL
jgi:tetratricopeptide (TPR) repeat protein